MPRRFLDQPVTRTHFLKWLGGASVASVLAACSTPAAPPTAAPAATQAPAAPTSTTAVAPTQAPAVAATATPAAAAQPAVGGAVQIIYGQVWDPGEQPVIEKWLKGFNDRYAGKINVVQRDAGDQDKQTAAAAAGTLPDVIAVWHGLAQAAIKAGWLKSLAAYIKRDNAEFDIDDFTPPSLYSYRHHGELYALPFDEGPELLWYNLDMFDAAGVKYPDENWTFDDLLNACVKLTKGEGNDKIFGMASLPIQPFTPSQNQGVAPFGGSWVNDDESETQIDAPETIKGMQWWLDLMTKYKAIPTPDETKQIKGWPFFAQRAAMGITGTWSASQAASIGKFRYDVSEYPKGPKQRITGAQGSAEAMSKDTKHPEETWVFLKEFLSKEGQKVMFADTGRGSPARASAWAAFEKSPSAMPSAKIILPILKSYAKHEHPIGPQFLAFQKVIGPLWDKVVAGQQSVEDFARDAKQGVTPLLADNKIEF